MKSIDQLVHEIVNREGGFVNNSSDKGGATKYGITKTVLSAWRKKPVTVQDVKNLSIEEAGDIYKKKYITDPGYLPLGDAALIEQMIDAGVNHGVGMSVKLLQRALKVEEDGSIGPGTLAAYKKLPPAKVVVLFMAKRAKYYGAILANNPSQRTFGGGWFNRYGEMMEKYADTISE